MQLGTALPPSAIPPMSPMAPGGRDADAGRYDAGCRRCSGDGEKTKEKSPDRRGASTGSLEHVGFPRWAVRRSRATSMPILGRRARHASVRGARPRGGGLRRHLARCGATQRGHRRRSHLRDFRTAILRARGGTSPGLPSCQHHRRVNPIQVQVRGLAELHVERRTDREAQEAVIRQVIKGPQKKPPRGREGGRQGRVKAELSRWRRARAAVGSVAQTAANVPRLAAATGERLVPDLSPKPLSHEDQQVADQLDAIGTMVDSYKPQVEAANVLRADLDTYNNAQQAFAPRDAQMQAAVTAHDTKVGALNAEMSRLGQGLEDEQNRFEQRVDAWKRRGSPNSEVALINAQQSQLKIHIDAFNRRQEEVRREAAQARNELDQVRVPYEQEFNALKAQGAALEPRIAAATKTEQELAKLQKQAEPLQRRLTKAQSQDLHTILKDYHDDFWGSFGKAFADQLVENASERTGECRANCSGCSARQGGAGGRRLGGGTRRHG